MLSIRKTRCLSLSVNEGIAVWSVSRERPAVTKDVITVGLRGVTSSCLKAGLGTGLSPISNGGLKSSVTCYLCNPF